MMRKMFLSFIGLALLVTPAFAGGRPEYDTVGLDSGNYFKDATMVRVVENNVVGDLRINEYSDWLNYPETVNGIPIEEAFTNLAGTVYPDPCFDGYASAFVDAGNAAEYTWRIVLQMKPQSDINLNIVDCVMRQDGESIWTDAGQTGRYRTSWGRLYFVPEANPSVTVRAIPGPFATPGFVTPFHMDGRLMPGLEIVCLNHAQYTSKAFWEEGIILVLPKTGQTSSCGDAMYNLKQGDAIEVTVHVPGSNTADIRYGKDNVILKYVGIQGTYFYHGES